MKLLGYFKIYSQYAGMFNRLVALLNQIVFDNSRVEQLIRAGEQKMQAEHGCKKAPAVELANTRALMPFQIRTILTPANSKTEDYYNFYSFPSLLLIPICFIYTFSQQLSELVHATPKTHPDHIQLTSTLTRTEEMINGVLAETDVTFRTLLAQHNIKTSTIGFFSDERRLIKEGQLST